MQLPWRVQLLLRDVALRWPRKLPYSEEQLLVWGDERGTLVAVGDISFSGRVGTRISSEGALAPFGDLAGVLKRATFATGNLETMITSCLTRNGLTGSFLRADPEAVAALEAAGLRVVTCANNHCLDHGAEGLLECLEILRNRGIISVGAGATREAAEAPMLVEAAGVRIGFLARCDDFRMQAAERLRATPAPLERGPLLEAVRALRSRADVLVVHLHLGYEFELHPMLHHRDLARACVDAGANLVLCHHAHVPMGVEVRGSGVIAHGLGNFCGPVDAYMRDGHPYTDRSLMLEVGFG